jgi:hypothetical protein
MPNSIDFRAEQIQVKKIIVKNDGLDQSKLLIYGIEAEDATTVNEGVINTTHFPQGSIGSDVFLFVSGATGARGTNQAGISVFGGDLHISGNLTIGGGGGGGGGSSYFDNPSGMLVTSSGSLYISGGLNTTHLSASSGAEITGSFVQGFDCISSGQNSHSQGSYNESSGLNAHTEGQSNVASGDTSHAEGMATLAAGLVSHSEGWLSHAYGTGSHAGGLGTVASGSIDGVYPPTIVQTVFGKYNKRNNTGSLFVIGNGSDDGDYLRSDILRVNSGSIEFITASFSQGGQCIASGVSSHAEGSGTRAFGYASHAEGYNTVASASYSHAGGWHTVASASYQTVFGRYNVLGNTDSIFIIGNGSPYGPNSDILRVTTGSVQVTGSFINGLNCLASGDHSHAEGSYTVASSSYSHTEGADTLANGYASHAEGRYAVASASYSHAEGTDTLANGYASHAEGGYTKTSHNYAHSEGYYTTGSGLSSHAEGWYSESPGLASHAEGIFCIAYGTGSHAGGLFTIASGAIDGGAPTTIQAVFGKYNKRANTDSLFVIGDGSGDTDADRHDIFRVNSGSVEVSGAFSVSGSKFSQFNGLCYYPKILSSITPGYTASISDYVIAVSCSAGGDGVALPASPDFGTSFIVKDIYGNAAANNIIINIAGTGKIDGSLTYTINSNFGFANFIYFGGNNWGRV